MNTQQNIQGQIVDLENRQVFPGRIHFDEEKILDIERLISAPKGRFVLPGFIDSHIHIESSMLIPSEFARLATIHGTVAAVSDPHEIANVCGVEGVRFMMQNGRSVPFYFYFGAPSCVPATDFETAGARLGPAEVEQLLEKEGLLYLSEMMNYPGVLAKDPQILAKIATAKRLGRPVDGHAPGLRNPQAAEYAAAGISTDHECSVLEEALEKIANGMRILIREGSAAKNFAALHPLFTLHPDKIMLCSDDKHPDDLLEGHINRLVSAAVKVHGYDLFDVLRAACIHPIEHYGLDVGRLRIGDSPDFIVTKDLQHFEVIETYIRAQLVAQNGQSLLPFQKAMPVNFFCALPVEPHDFLVLRKEDRPIQVIEAIDGELITKKRLFSPKIENEAIICDLQRDILKIAVVNRYQKAPVSVAFIHGFGLKRGAIASSVAHDSHNVLAVGTSDEALYKVVNAIIDKQGGVALWDESKLHTLALPVAGLMSLEEGPAVAETYSALTKKAHMLGSQLQAPFMTLSFMALLVIPSLKMSDQGLFDVDAFAFTSL